MGEIYFVEHYGSYLDIAPKIYRYDCDSDRLFLWVAHYNKWYPEPDLKSVLLGINSSYGAMLHRVKTLNDAVDVIRKHCKDKFNWYVEMLETDTKKEALFLWNRTARSMRTKMGKVCKLRA